MTANPRKRQYPSAEGHTTLETGWLYAHCVHGKQAPVWLYQTLAHVCQQSHLPALTRCYLAHHGQPGQPGGNDVA